MDTSYNTFCQLVGMVKSWIPWRSEPANVSRDFWMPDQSCRVCYECDSQFTILNRRHHCRLCGRIFCGKCTENSVPIPSCDPRITLEEREKIRVCNYCYKQWKEGTATLDNGKQDSNLFLSTSPSATSLASTRSSGTGNSSSITLGSTQYSVGPYQHDQQSTGLKTNLSSLMEANKDRQSRLVSGRGNDLVTVMGDPSSNRYGLSVNKLIIVFFCIFLN